MKVSVFTDLRFTEYDEPTGVGKHITQMALGLSRIPQYEVSVLAARDQLINGTIRPANTLSALPARATALPWKGAEALWTTTGGPSQDHLVAGADWVYCPKNDFIPLKKTKLAVTLHGAHELDPEFPQENGFAARLNRARRRMSYRRIVEKADLLLTVSEFLKRQVIDWFDCEEDRIEIVGNGVEPAFFEAAGRSGPSPGRDGQRPYLISVGGLNRLDGAQATLDTAELLSRRLPDMEILVAGAQHEPPYLERARQLRNIRLLGYVPVERLAPLMGGAAALLFLPEYETFGIAAAEAMAAGTLVITSGRTAVPEIVGDAGLYVTGGGEECVEKVAELLNDSALGESLRARGRFRAKHFTWDACIRRLVSCLGKYQ